MSTTAKQVVRILRLAPYLQAHPDVTVAEVARSLGVRPAQVVKDLQVLMMCGTGPYGGQMIDVDLDALEDDGRIRISNAEVLAHPMRFTPAEVVPLMVGLRLLADVTGPGQHVVIERALEKLRSIAGPDAEAAGRVEVRTVSASQEIRDAIDTAKERAVRLRITYAGHATTQRLVDVDQIILRDGLTYLQAWSDAATEGDEPGWRTFRLDRILDAEVTDEPSLRRPDPPHTDTWTSTLARADTVVLDVDPRGEWVAEAHPVQGREPRPDGKAGSRLHLRVADRQWFISLVLRLGDSVTVISPDDAAQAAREAAAAALRAYS